MAELSDKPPPKLIPDEVRLCDRKGCRNPGAYQPVLTLRNLFCREILAARPDVRVCEEHALTLTPDDLITDQNWTQVLEVASQMGPTLPIRELTKVHCEPTTAIGPNAAAAKPSSRIYPRVIDIRAARRPAPPPPPPACAHVEDAPNNNNDDGSTKAPT